MTDGKGLITAVIDYVPAATNNEGGGGGGGYEKMQAKPAYLPIEICYKSQEQQYMNVGLAQPVTEEHTKLQANPAYVSIEMMS